MKTLFIFPILSLIPVLTFAQIDDTTKVFQLKEHVVSDKVTISEMDRLNETEGTAIYSGKKNELILMSKLYADLSTNAARQVFAKVPGLTVWENDGSGIQIGVATRGLSANRSWEFNNRQNGYDISAESFGYPEAYYNPPMEAVERIELVRGAASLQYGPQFGGLLNYVLKNSDVTKPISVESIQTFGSYGLYNSYTSIGGKKNKFRYFGYFHHRNAEGWRQNSAYRINNGHINLGYDLTSKITISAEFTSMYYESQQPGGLNDSMFAANARQSVRSRNWFSAPTNLAAVTANYTINDDAKVNFKAFTLIGERNSVGFTRPINVLDNMGNRQVDADHFFNFGMELRYLQSYKLLNNKSSLATGVRYYQSDMNRFAGGPGNSASNYDINRLVHTWNRELNFNTQNTSVFAENMFKLTKKLAITPGIRYEMLNASAEGRIALTNGNINPKLSERRFILAGIGSEYQVTETSNVYANFSQSYRPVSFSELTPSATTDSIDPNMKDGSGYNFDFGYRGKYKNFLSFDVGGFYLNYNNKIGTINQNGTVFRTNIGAAVSQGVETFVELNPCALLKLDNKGKCTIFGSYAFIDAKYVRWDDPAIATDATRNINGKKLENAPQQILRTGISYAYNNFGMNFQYSHVDECFSDAANTVKSNAAGTIGLIPSYNIMDASASYLYKKMYSFKFGVNNLANVMYFTRRAGGYPGPGLMPANARTFYVTIGIKI